MSIEVKVSLSRNSAVFLTGEDFTVQISLTNSESAIADGAAGRSLAWGCVQLHCEENVTAAQRAAKAQQRRHNWPGGGAVGASTAVTRAKQALYSSEPAILFCDIHLGPGAVRHFETHAQIPLDLPPSFKLVQLPIKVFNVGIDVSAAVKQPPEAIVGEGNPFLGKDIKSPSIVEIAVNRIEEICSIRKQRFYEIKSGGRLITTVVIFKNVFKLGDDIVGRFEFAQGNDERMHCLQALVRAEIVETNLAAAADNSGGGASSTATASDVHVHAFGTEHMVTAFVRETHFKLQLPMSAVPSFTTDAVKVRWRLRFEFVTTTQQLLLANGPGGGAGDGHLRKLADDLAIETVKWDLPISVLSCNPFNAGLSCPQPSTTTFSI